MSRGRVGVWRGRGRAAQVSSVGWGLMVFFKKPNMFMKPFSMFDEDYRKSFRKFRQGFGQIFGEQHERSFVHVW